MAHVPTFARSVLALLCIAHLNSVQVTSAELNIGQFTKYAHKLDSGSVTLTDSKTMLIKNFKYDGEGPDAWFQVAVRDGSNSGYSYPVERADLSKNKRIPDENGSCDIVKAYNGKDITLVLPSNLTFANVEYVALYCYKYQHNFGYINIPQNLANLNAYPPNKRVPDFCSGSSDSIMHMLRGGSAMFLSTSLVLFTFAMSIVH